MTPSTDKTCVFSNLTVSDLIVDWLRSHNLISLPECGRNVEFQKEFEEVLYYSNPRDDETIYYDLTKLHTTRTIRRANRATASNNNNNSRVYTSRPQIVDGR